MKVVARLLVTFISLSSMNLYAALPVWISGKITKVYADPSDIVYIISSANSSPCGTSYYHIRRSNENFKEFYSVILTAFTTGKTAAVYVVECSETRNITSHGAVSF